jgi:hypothetical protein
MQRCDVILKFYQILRYKDIKDNEIANEIVNKTYK